MASTIRDTIDFGKAQTYALKRGQQAMKLASEYFMAHTKMYCPIDTGYLISTIQEYEAAFGSYSVTVLAWYAPFVEFGHWTWGGKGGVAGRFVAPNPFMRRALADTIAAFPELVSSMATSDVSGMQAPGWYAPRQTAGGSLPMAGRGGDEALIGITF